jgi:hypothetical protein
MLFSILRIILPTKVNVNSETSEQLVFLFTNKILGQIERYLPTKYLVRKYNHQFEFLSFVLILGG